MVHAPGEEAHHLGAQHGMGAVGKGQQGTEGALDAGEVTGGAHGASRLGGCAIADGLVFGRIAADTGVAAKPAAL